MCENRDKIIEKIKNLLDLANNNPSEHEAISAALKAQELMAKYHLDSHDIEDVEITDEIIEDSIYVGKGNKWKYSLASIVGRNFCCKVFTRGTSKVVFYGYEKDTTIATTVFKYLFQTGNKLADKVYRDKKFNGYNTKGVKNQFLLGYLDGIKQVLDRQCTSLMLVVPKEVENSYEEFTSNNNFRTIRNTISYSSDARVYNEGKSSGINIANARALESGIV